MKHNHVDSLRLPLSRAILGTMTFGDTTSSEQAEEMVVSSIKAGITMVDTANGYSSGSAERILAPLLAKFRDNLMVATKVGIPHSDLDGAAPLSKLGITRCFTASLERLEVEKVDVLYLHVPDRSTPILETLLKLGELLSDNKIAAYGVSNYSSWQVAEICSTAEKIGIPNPIIAQQMYNLVARKLEDEFTEFSTTKKINLVTYNPLAGGILTDRYNLNSNPTEGRFGSSAVATMYKGRYWNQEIFEVKEELSKIAKVNKMSLAELSIKWLLGKSSVSSVILGASKPSNLLESLTFFQSQPLTQELIEKCDLISSVLRGPSPNYNR